MATNSSTADESHDTPRFKSPQLPQTQSVFFTKLLPELREYVYSFVFGELPRIKPDETPLYWISGAGPGTPPQCFPVDGSTMLLQTCQQMYFEAFAVFYRNTVFKVFTPPENVTRFPPAALDNIRTIWIDIRLNAEYGCLCCDDHVEGYFAEKSWAKAVELFNEQLPGLRHLHISIMRRKDSRPGNYFRPLLERKLYPALMGIRKLSCFQVIANFKNEEPENAPFEIVPFEHGIEDETEDEQELSEDTEETEGADGGEDDDDAEYSSPGEDEGYDEVFGWRVAFH
ncbi:hypothetical protein MGYG_01106 [Nannizzia gypsea CBS 118893]|uniref:DUF7730 domain-containing protein n=1 Tax=Arthroderma gypseum (strain ATCC MYA-4604 / CBS 118893) TaxID=535722 RepID=E5QYJ3_ARTGP|nr:hypothetical protein MGYG_01106 [Nannizzia gypsea CBS 118893]EFQ98069.1 hypothetical protein MGYG_01106 [Nannizzia gypsea CBS 118893]